MTEEMKMWLMPIIRNMATFRRSSMTVIFCDLLCAKIRWSPRKIFFQTGFEHLHPLPCGHSKTFELAVFSRYLGTQKMFFKRVQNTYIIFKNIQYIPNGLTEKICRS